VASLWASYNPLRGEPARQRTSIWIAYGWIKRIAPFLWNALGEDRVQDGSEAILMPGVRFNFVRQGNLRLDMSRGHETFAGRRFATGRAHADGRAQITRWLNAGGTLERAANGACALFQSLVSRAALAAHQSVESNVLGRITPACRAAECSPRELIRVV
jgi:hypothetical protein